MKMVVQASLDLDTDNDEMDDDWELANGLVVGVDDSANDDDGDKKSNGDEFLARTDPQDASSLLRVLEVVVDGVGGYDVRFSSVDGVSYQLQFSSDLQGWADLVGAEVTESGAETVISGVGLPDAGEGYLRVVVSP